MIFMIYIVCFQLERTLNRLCIGYRLFAFVKLCFKLKKGNIRHICERSLFKRITNKGTMTKLFY